MNARSFLEQIAIEAHNAGIQKRSVLTPHGKWSHAPADVVRRIVDEALSKALSESPDKSIRFIIEKPPRKTCATSKFSEASNNKDVFACNSKKFIDGYPRTLKPDEMCYSEQGGMGMFFMGANFGCVHHQPKEG